MVMVAALATAGFLVWSHKGASELLSNSAANLGVSTSSRMVIEIIKPKPWEHVSQFVEVLGKTRTSENHLNIRLKDFESGKVLIEDEVIVVLPRIGEYGKWNYEFGVENFKEGQKLKIEAFNHSPYDQSEINKVSVPVLVWHDTKI